MVVEGIHHEFNYPIQMGIAYLLFVGYFLRTIFVSVNLPASVGVMVSGFVFSFFFQADMLTARYLLQQLAYFLVLLTAGFEISLKELRPHIFVMAFLPAVGEVLAIAGYANYSMKWPWEDGLILATVLVAIGDGLVIPMMKMFKADRANTGHPLLKLICTWAPLEVSFVLTSFGILSSCAGPKSPDSKMVLSLAIIFRIIATVVIGILLGRLASFLVTRCKELEFRGQLVFTGSPVESFLMVSALAMVAYGLGSDDDGKIFIPMGLCPGSLFQPELLVIVMGCSFASTSDHKRCREVEAILGGVQVFGQLLLFTMLGSRTRIERLPEMIKIVPIMAVGLIARFLMIFVTTAATIPWRGCICNECRAHRKTFIIQEAIFCCLCVIPRATVQGALGASPTTDKLLKHIDPNHTVQVFIFEAASFYIVVLSVLGMMALNLFGAGLLQATKKRSCETIATRFRERSSSYDPPDMSVQLSMQRSVSSSGPAVRKRLGTSGMVQTFSMRARFNPQLRKEAEAAAAVLAERYGFSATELSTALNAAQERKISMPMRAESEPLAMMPFPTQPSSCYRATSAPEEMMSSVFLLKEYDDAYYFGSEEEEEDFLLAQFDARGRLFTGDPAEGELYSSLAAVEMQDAPRRSTGFRAGDGGEYTIVETGSQANRHSGSFWQRWMASSNKFVTKVISRSPSMVQLQSHPEEVEFQYPSEM